MCNFCAIDTLKPQQDVRKGRREPIDSNGRSCESTVTLDRCPDGHGLWFDQGELAAVIRSHADDQEEQVASFFGDLYRSELNAAQKGS